MKSKILYLLLFSVCLLQTGQVKAEEVFFYFQGEKFFFTERTDKMLIKLSKDADIESLLSLIQTDETVKFSDLMKGETFFDLSDGLFIFLDAKNNNIPLETLNKYKDNQNVISAQLLLEYGNGKLQGIFDEFIVLLKPTTSFTQL